MFFKNIKVQNFKSFKNLEINLNNFCTIIGPNAAGKSNFIQIFQFIRDISNYGLDNAISMQGGVEYLRNINIGSTNNFSLEITSEQKYRRPANIRGIENDYFFEFEFYQTIYRFAVVFKKRGLGFDIVEDELIQKFEIFKVKFLKGKNIKREKLSQEGKRTFNNIKGKIRVNYYNIPKNLPIETIKENSDLYLRFFEREKIDPKSILIESIPAFLMPNMFEDISIYDFDPKLPKKAVPIIGKAELEEDGSNLAIAIKEIIGNKENKRKFSNLLKDVLPFVEDLDVERFIDKTLFFKIKEKFNKDKYIPASLISDGTINIAALIIALFFGKKRLIIIEEPEKAIHPYLLSKIVDMMKDAARKRQILITTHNPNIVGHSDLENILLISRGEDGYTNISRPIEKETVKIFLKNELGFDELFVQNLLEN